MKKLVKIGIVVFILLLSFWNIIMIHQAGKEKKITIKNTMEAENLTIRGILLNGVSMDLETFFNSGFYEEESNRLMIPPNASLEIIGGVNDYYEIYFTSIQEQSVIEFKDYKLNKIQEVDLFSLKNEAEEFVFTNYYSKSELWNLFWNEITIGKGILCLISLIILFFLYFFIIERLNQLLKHCMMSYTIKEIIEINILVFLFIFSTIYTVLDLIPTIWIFLFLAIFLFLLLKKLYGAPIHNVYIILVTFVGILMLFLLPMFRVPDEFCHFTNVYAKSFVPKEVLGGTKGEELVLFEQELEETFFSFQGGYGGDFKNGKCYARKFYHDMTKRMKSDSIGTRWNWYANCANLSVFPYIPAILITTVLRQVSIPPIVLLLVVRWMNFLFMVLLGYVSLRVIPIWKKYIFLVLMLPVTLQQGFGINQDSLNNVLFILSFSLLIYSIKKEELMSKIEIIGILMVLVGLSNCKLGYAPISLLVILIPNSRFKKRTEGITYKIGILVTILLINIVNYSAMMPSAETISWYNYNSVKDVLLNPIETIIIYIKTFMDRFEFDFFLGLINGMSHHYWSITGMAELVSLAIFIILLFTAAQEEQFLNSSKFYFIQIIIFGMICGLIYTSLWCGWSVKGSVQVNGLQPRYFIPPALLLYISCSNSLIHVNLGKEKRDLLLYGGISFIEWIALLTIVINAYVFL